MCMGVLPVCICVCTTLIHLGKVYPWKHRGCYPGENCVTEDNNGLACVCEQYQGSHGHWAQTVVKLRNTCPSLGDGWDVSKEK